MARRLIATVSVDGTVYTAGSAVPDDVAEQITNPAAWADDEPTSQDNSDAPEAERPRKPTSRRSS